MSKRQRFFSAASGRHQCPWGVFVLLLLAALRSHAEGGNFDAPAPTSQPDGPSTETLNHYNSLYAPDERRALQLSGKEQARFAVVLLEAVKSLKDDPDLSALLLEKSYEFGIKDPAGYDTAAAAIRKLAESGRPNASLPAKAAELFRREYKHASGQRRIDAGRSLLDALMSQGQEQMASGKLLEASKTFSEATTVASSIHSSRSDEINAAIRSVHGRMRVKEKIDKLLEKLHEKPEAFVAGEAAELYVTGMDMPGEAAKLPGIDVGSDVAQMAALGAADPASLSEADCMTLAGWYASLATGADETSRVIILERARTYYNRFLELHDKKDGDRLKASGELAKVEKQLEQMDSHPRTADRIVVWNTHNAKANDRGTLKFNLHLLHHGEVVWSQPAISIDWKPSAATFVAIPAPPITFDALRIEITTWHGHGAGLAEIEVWKGSDNLALGGAVTADNTYQPTVGPPSNLTDGITDTPVEYYHGYWLALDGKVAKVEVTLPNGMHRPGSATH